MKKATMSIGTLVIVNIVTMLSLKGLAVSVSYGLGVIFFYLVAAVLFLFPIAFVSAELAAAWPKKGGVYRWVGEAFGPRFGFLSIFLVWIQSTIWYPTALTFGAVTMAFMGGNLQSDEAFASNKIYVLLVCLVIYWCATFINFKGLSSGIKISRWGGILGTLVPVGLLLAFGVIWLMTGHDSAMNLSWDALVPKVHGVDDLVLAFSIITFFFGIEVSAIHIKEIDNPTKNYPKAIVTSAIIALLAYCLGTLAIALIVPGDNVNITQGLLVAFDTYLRTYHIHFLEPVIAIMLSFGVLASVITWIAGPSKGLLSVGDSGFLPPFMQKVNKNGVQVNILWIQGTIVTILLLLFVLLPSVQDVFQILTQLTGLLYLTVYGLIFASGIYLRIKEPNRTRPYEVPFGRVGMFTFAGIGLLGVLITYVLLWFPPAQLNIANPIIWYAVLAAGNIIFVGTPFVIYSMKKPSWKNANADIEPFSWEK